MVERQYFVEADGPHCKIVEQSSSTSGRDTLAGSGARGRAKGEEEGGRGVGHSMEELDAHPSEVERLGEDDGMWCIFEERGHGRELERKWGKPRIVGSSVGEKEWALSLVRRE